MSEIRQINWPIGIVVPKDKLWVERLAEDLPFYTVSDVIPTAAITPDWPVIGTDTFGNIDWAHKREDSPWDGYVLRGMVREDGWFTRMYFTKVISETDKLEEVTSDDKVGSYPWPPILDWIKFEEDLTEMINSTIVDVNGVEGVALVPKWVVTYGWAPEVSHNTTFIIKKYVASSKWQLRNANHVVFEPTIVMWNLPGSAEVLPECLHDEVIVPGRHVQAKLVQESGTVTIPTGSDGASQVFPRTNVTTRLPTAIEDKQEMIGYYYVRTLTIIIPPPRPEPSYRTD